MKPKYIVGIAIIILFLVFASISFQSAITPYVPITEAKASGKTVQIKGATIRESAKYDEHKQTFNFIINDSNGESIQVNYHGVKPSNFESAKEIVAKGRFHNGIFEADELLVKCPSKYEAESMGGAEL